MSSKFFNIRTAFYLFILANFSFLLYIYSTHGELNLDELKTYLNSQNFVVAYLLYISILIFRGMTFFPGTPFLLLGIYMFEYEEVLFAIEIAIFSYAIIIYNFSHKLNFQIPEKILAYEAKIRNKEVPIIFLLCFVPGVSINILIYFLSTIGIKLKNILIGIIAGTMITSSLYIAAIKYAFESF
ncbi:hypothetical protein OAR97_03070 [Arcobacteraceae bacterium]|nr:hypothetical protein [Arcobacteraceae bacterium]